MAWAWDEDSLNYGLRYWEASGNFNRYFSHQRAYVSWPVCTRANCLFRICFFEEMDARLCGEASDGQLGTGDAQRWKQKQLDPHQWIGKVNTTKQNFTAKQTPMDGGRSRGNLPTRLR